MSGPILTDELCTICGAHLWAMHFDGAVAHRRCPTCDRPRCANCREPFGPLFHDLYQARWHLDVMFELCELCDSAPKTDLEGRQ